MRLWLIVSLCFVTGCARGIIAEDGSINPRDVNTDVSNGGDTGRDSSRDLGRETDPPPDTFIEDNGIQDTNTPEITVPEDVLPDIPEDVVVDIPPVDVGPNCTDIDGDGYGIGPDCMGPDCDDDNRNVNPTATEVCNGFDDNCNLQVDENLGSTTCGMGVCRRTVQNCLSGRPQSCQPLSPRTETCNNLDDDCDGAIDNGLGTQTCGMGACQQTVNACVNGQVNVCTPLPSNPETCNSIDDNCDGIIDNGPAEVCNNMDDNCDGLVDNGISCGGNAPANDTCAAATPITLNTGTTTVSGTTTGATNSPESCISGPDVLYSFTLTRQEVVYIDSFGSAFDTTLGFVPGCGTAADFCQSDACSTTSSQLAGVFLPGTHYFIVDGATAGAFTLHLQHIPVGNDPSGEISTTSFTLSGNTTNGGNTTRSCGGTSAGPDVWFYWFTCPGTTGGSFSATTCGPWGDAAFDSVLELVNGDRTGGGCNDDSSGLFCATGQSELTATVSSGAGFHVLFVDGYSSTDRGTFDVDGTRP